MNVERRLITADGRRAQAFSCTRTRHGTWRMQETAALRNEWENSHQWHRPSYLGRSPCMMPGSEAAFGHEAEEEILRFAREVAEWLQSQAGPADAAPLVVFAAPQFLGMLRHCLPNADRDGMRLVEGELTTLRPYQLAEHPLVITTLEQTSRAT